MRHAITLPTGFAMMMFILVGLTLLIGVALPQDIDLAIFFAMMFSGILLVLGCFYFIAERISRRVEREDATSESPGHLHRVRWGVEESPAASAIRRHPETKCAPPIWGYSRALCEGHPDQ